MIYNFGQNNISHLNVPWGGVRNSSLDHFFISTPTNSYSRHSGLFSQLPTFETASTGGWFAWSNDSLGNSPSLGMAHSITTNTNDNIFRYGDAGDFSNLNNHRDYHVFTMIRRPHPGQLGFGKSMSFRYFYVLGANVDSVKNTILQENLVAHTLDTAYVSSSINVDSIRVNFNLDGSTISINTTQDSTGLLLKTKPYLNSYPLFKITSATNQEVISSNPYFFSPDAYDGTTVSIKLLGFQDTPTDNLAVINDSICGIQLCACTNSLALNYNLLAAIDDGTCITPPSNQNITLPHGWCMFSTYIEPQNTDISQILSPIVEYVTIVKNNLGEAYLPEWDFNGIGEIVNGQGYQIKVDTTGFGQVIQQSIELEISGGYLHPENTPIQLEVGWNLIGYLRTDEVSAVDILAELNASENLVIAKDYLSGAYLPQWDFNGLGYMVAGRAYQVKTIQADTLWILPIGQY